MTVDLTCRSCDGKGVEWGTSVPGQTGRPCPTCAGAGQLDLHQVALDVARAHGTRIAVEYTGVSDKTVVRLRRDHDGYDRGRGRPTRAEMAAMPPRLSCDCVRCIDHRRDLAYTINRVLGMNEVDRPELGGTWRDQAACATADPDLFFPERGQSIGPAVAYCRACPVRARCLDAGLGEKHGIWGGLSERGRRRLRRIRKTQGQEAA